MRRFAQLGVAPFGDAGAIAAAAACTRALRALEGLGLPVVGYKGLFLPVAEDAGLAARSFDGAPGFTCGCCTRARRARPASTSAVPGDADRARVAGLFLDTAAVAWRLDKPLACRVLPMAGSTRPTTRLAPTPAQVLVRALENERAVDLPRGRVKLPRRAGVLCLLEAAHADTKL